MIPRSAKVCEKIKPENSTQSPEKMGELEKTAADAHGMTNTAFS